MDDLNKVLKNKPEVHQARLLRSHVHGVLKEYEKCVEDASQLIKNDTKHLHAYKERAYALLKLRKRDEAIQDYAVIIRLEPSAEAYYNRGYCYSLLKQNDKAVEDYQQACERSNWKEPQYIQTLGNANLRLGKYAEALKHYERLLQFKDYMELNGDSVRKNMETCRTALAK